MNKQKPIVILLIVATMLVGRVGSSYGQDNKKPNNPKSAAQTSKELKKKEWERKRQEKHAYDLALKAHMKHQTKAVRKRMKKDAKIAKKHNDGA